MLRYSTEKYFGFGADNLQVTSDELIEQLGLSELAIRKVGRLIEAEGFFWAAYGRKDPEGNSWVCTLAPGMDGIARFDKVGSIEQYLERRTRPPQVALDISESLEKAVRANPKNVQEVAVTQLELSNSYYRSALSQSQSSFRSALVWATVGTLLIVAAVFFLLIERPANLSYVSLIGGAIIEAIAGLNFYLYGQASKQLASFQVPLDRIGRFLLANSVCENLEGEVKQSTRAELVRLIMDVPVKSDAEKK